MPPNQATNAQSQDTKWATPAPWVDSLASLFDTRFTIPGTSINFGLDPIIGLLPVAGDTVTLIIGSAMLVESHRLRLGWGTHARIVANLVVDWLLGLIPGVDIVADTMFKAHKRNASLLHERARAKHGSEPRDRRHP